MRGEGGEKRKFVSWERRPTLPRKKEREISFAAEIKKPFQPKWKESERKRRERVAKKRCREKVVQEAFLCLSFSLPKRD